MKKQMRYVDILTKGGQIEYNTDDFEEAKNKIDKFKKTMKYKKINQFIANFDKNEEIDVSIPEYKELLSLDGI